MAWHCGKAQKRQYVTEDSEEYSGNTLSDKGLLGVSKNDLTDENNNDPIQECNENVGDSLRDFQFTAETLHPKK